MTFGITKAQHNDKIVKEIRNPLYFIVIIPTLIILIACNPII